MSELSSMQQLLQSITDHFADSIASATYEHREVTVEVSPEHLLEVCTGLRDKKEFAFQQLIDLCGVDYLHFGQSEWQTDESSATGFSRGVEPATMGRMKFGDETESTQKDKQRFASVVHLLSVENNHRVRVKCFATDDSFPVVPSLTGIWASANWYEREAFDLYGILYSDHPDLRRILTDYGFVGHPFRKDFPLVGHVEMRYDPQQKRVVYEPVSIEPRVLVPRVIREDHRYAGESEAAE